MRQKAGHHRVHVSRALKEDTAWWLEHLELLNGDGRVPMVAAGVAHEDDVYLDARGGSGGVGVFVGGAFVGLACGECNVRYSYCEGMEYAPCSPGLGVRRQVAGAAKDEPLVHANHWELFAFCVILALFPDMVRNRFLVVRLDSISACKRVRGLSASLESPATVRMHVRHTYGAREVEL